MGTKPPQSKAQKKSHKSAKKLPGPIAKRFKLKREESLKEDTTWAEKEVKFGDGSIIEVQVAEEPPRLLDMARQSKKSKKQNTFNSNRCQPIDIE